MVDAYSDISTVLPGTMADYQDNLSCMSKTIASVVKARSEISINWYCHPYLQTTLVPCNVAGSSRHQRQLVVGLEMNHRSKREGGGITP